MLETITYFHSTQFAVSNGMIHDTQNPSVVAKLNLQYSENDVPWSQFSHQQ